MDPILILTVLFVTGLIVEAMTGAITAGEKQMDLFGVLVVANVTAFGGGVIRDLLLSRSPILFIAKPELLFFTSAAALFMVLIAGYFNRLRILFLTLDAVGLVTFTVVGAIRALDMGYGVSVASLAGIVTGVFGGILRDMLCDRIPLAFRKELYASISIASVWLFLLLDYLAVPRTVSIPIILFMGVFFRMLAVKYDIRIPMFVYKVESKDK